MGHRFFVEGAWNCERSESAFSICGNEADPMAHITRAFREMLLGKALYALVTPGYTNDGVVGPNKGADGAPHCVSVQQYIQLLNDSNKATSEASACTNMFDSYGKVDDVARWWGSIVSVAAFWLQGDDQSAEDLYSTIDAFPVHLQSVDEPLARSTYLAYRARRTFLNGKKIMCHASCIKQCDAAGELLRNSLNVNTTHKHPLNQAVQLLVCDWLLSTRTAIWQQEQDNKDENDVSSTMVSQSELHAFQQDLTSLRRLSQFVKAALPRVFLHEATSRLMAGASPARTQRLLDTSLRKRCTTHKVVEKGVENDVEKLDFGDREYATALLLACRHLPAQILSSPGQRKTMLNDAAKVYEKIGDRKSVQDCKNMMMKLRCPGDAGRVASKPIPVWC